MSSVRRESSSTRQISRAPRQFIAAHRRVSGHRPRFATCSRHPNAEAGPMHPDAPAPQKPPEIRELTVRSVVCGLIVAAIMGASYPYIVLKLGFGPNVSVVSAFFGYLALGIAFK